MRPYLVLLPILAALASELPAQVRRNQPTGDSRLGAFWARNGETKGLGLEAEITVSGAAVVCAEAVRVDDGVNRGDLVSAGLGWSERTSYGRFAATYSWGKVDDAATRHDREIARLIYSYDVGRDWQLEVSLNRYLNPDTLAPDLTATRFMFRYGNGGPLRLDLGYSSKDALTGLRGGTETWFAGLSLGF